MDQLGINANTPFAPYFITNSFIIRLEFIVMKHVLTNGFPSNNGLFKS
jgi:hypothetical protein